MVKTRDWGKDVEGTDIEFLRKEGNYLICSKDGFIFRTYKTNWPPTRLSAEVALDPTGYYKFLVEKIHGDKYNLDKVVYTKINKNITVGCPVHGDFQIQAANFKRGKGCPLCSYMATGDKNRSNKEAFLEKAYEIHGDVYDYSLVEYTTSNGQISIICSIHGIFQQGAYNHLVGKGCLTCGLERSKLSRVLSAETVLERFSDVHGDRYDYSEVVYIGDAHSSLKIICKEHGIFLQTYANHYHNRQGCPECAKEFSARLRSGFMKSADSKDYASLYLIECSSDDEVFFKIGITTKPLKTRFAGPSTMPYDYEVKYLFISGGEHIWNLERLLHYEYKDQKYLPLLEFGGRYECFSEIDIDEYKKLVYTLA